MATGNFYRGTSVTQDLRFSNKDKTLISSRNWPEEFEQKVDVNKVELTVIKSWIDKRVTELLGMEDEVLVNLIVSELEKKPESIKEGVCPKKLSILLAGFLEKNSFKFVKELWALLLEGMNSPNGIPKSLIAKKQEELQERKQEILSQKEQLERMKQFLNQQQNEVTTMKQNDKKKPSRSKSKSRSPSKHSKKSKEENSEDESDRSYEKHKKEKMQKKKEKKERHHHHHKK